MSPPQIRTGARPRAASQDALPRAVPGCIRVVLADDHRIVRDGICSLLAREADIEVVGVAADGLEALRLARELQPDVLVTDMAMPGLNGVEAIRRIHVECPAVRTMCLSMHDDSRVVMAMLNAGASGYVLKDSSSEELALAIRKVMSRKVYLSAELVTLVVEEMRHSNGRPAETPEAVLTPRERELVQLLSEGYSSSDVAERMHVSVKTVATHREHVMHKLHLSGVAELTRYALREGLSSLDTPCGAARRARLPRGD